MRSYPSSPPKLSPTTIHSTLTSPSLSPAQTPLTSTLPTPLISPLHSPFISPLGTPANTPPTTPPITPHHTHYTTTTSAPPTPPPLPPLPPLLAPPPPASPLLRFLCLNLSPLSPTSRFVLLSTGIFVFFMLNSYLEEYIFRVLPAFSYGWYITAFELTLFASFALVERAISGEGGSGVAGMFARKAPLRSHMTVAVAMTASRGLTNVSLQYLNYPTQVIFKSMKLLTVMAGSLCFLNASFTVSEYVSAVCLVASAVMFSYGDYAVSHPAEASGAAAVAAAVSDSSAELAASLHIGVIIVVASLVADAFHGTTQDTLMRALSASTLETMLFTNLFSSILAFIVVIIKGELAPALAYCLSHPAAYPLFVLRAVLIYLGVLCFLLLIQSNGVVVATAVTTVRKILSIIVSFVMFPKGWSAWYGVGFVAFCCGLASGTKKAGSGGGGGSGSGMGKDGSDKDRSQLVHASGTDEEGDEHVQLLKGSSGGGGSDGLMERGENGTNGVLNGLGMVGGGLGGGRLRRDTSLQHMNGMVGVNDSSDFSDGPVVTDMEDDRDTPNR